MTLGRADAQCRRSAGDAGVARTEVARYSTVDLDAVNPVSGARRAHRGRPRRAACISAGQRPDRAERQLGVEPGPGLSRTVVRASFARKVTQAIRLTRQTGGVQTARRHSSRRMCNSGRLLRCSAPVRAVPDLTGGAANDTTADLVNRSGSRPRVPVDDAERGAGSCPVRRARSSAPRTMADAICTSGTAQRILTRCRSRPSSSRRAERR